MKLNLAQRPFLNLQPVRRAGLLLGILGLLLAGVNVYLYWNHLSGQGVAESGLQELIEQVEEEKGSLEIAQAELAGFDPSDLNSKIEFANLRILQRTFSWSRLFDLVAETLPAEVRLASLTPSFGEGGRGRSVEIRTDRVNLEIRGEARTSEALLEFVDQLFAHPAFAEPDLHQEAARHERSVIAFSITAIYLPNVVVHAVAEPAKEIDPAGETEPTEEIDPEEDTE